MLTSSYRSCFVNSEVDGLLLAGFVVMKNYYRGLFFVSMFGQVFNKRLEILINLDSYLLICFVCFVSSVRFIIFIFIVCFKIFPK